MPRRTTALAAAAWLAGALVAAGGVALHDAPVALGHERWLVPAAVGGAHLGVGLCTSLALLGVARRWPRLAAFLGPALGLAAAAVWLVPPRDAALRLQPAPAPRSGPHVALVTLDTFRADHMGALGDTRGLTPNLDALAAQGLTFERAVTTIPLTAPAHATMLTGAQATEHGLLHNGGRLESGTVVEELRAAGYRTGAFVGAHVLDRRTGLSRGFTHYDDRWGVRQRLGGWGLLRLLELRPRPVTRPGDETVARAVRWLGASSDPALLWVHLYDAHGPYRPPPDFEPDPAALERARALDRAERPPRTQDPRVFVERFARGRPNRQKLMYAASVRWVDHLVGVLLEALGDDAVVLVLADHGESLDEHDYWFNHGARLFEPSLRVPMVVRWPGAVAPGREPGLVSVASTAAWLRAVAGLGAPPEPVTEVAAYTPGQQARALGLRDPSDTAPPQSAALRLTNRKLVSHRGSPVVLYELDTDPGETLPLSVPPELEGHAERVRAASLRAPPALDADELDRLRALGYVE